VVYLLRCADGTIYCGCTNDLVRRLGRHQRGDVKYTRGRLPVEVAYSEEAGGRGEALRREAALKRLPRGRKLRLCAAQTEPASQPAGKAPRKTASKTASKTPGKTAGKTADLQPDKPRSAARKL
jgi:putative endonuclease